MQLFFAHHPVGEEMEPAMRAGDDREAPYTYTIARRIMEQVGRVTNA